MRTACAVAALGCAAVAFAELGGNAFTRTGTLAWIAAVILVVLAFGERPERSTAGESAGVLQRCGAVSRLAPRSEWLVLLTTLVLAAVLLFFRLDRTPADPTSDHAEKLLDIRDVLRGEYPIFFPRNTGREAAVFYWAAAWSQLFGFGYWTLKFSTAAIGLLTVAATYGLARALYGSAVGCAAAFLLATSSWHLTISRIGLRYPFAPLASALMMWCGFRALVSNRRNAWLLLGIALGAAQYGYTSARILFILAAVWLLVRLALDRTPMPGGVGRLGAGTGIALLAAGLVLIPMIRYASESPAQFLQRSLTRTTNLEAPLPPHPGWQLLDNLGNALLMFNWRGDRNWFVCGDGRPMLDPISGALFVLGIGILAWRGVRQPDARSFYLLSALAVLLLPSALALAFPWENPSANRAGIVLPVVATIAALPFGVLVERMSQTVRHAPSRAAAAGLAAAAVAIVVLNAQRYFVDCDRLYRTTTPNSAEIGAAAREFVSHGGKLSDVYLVTWPHWVDVRLIGLAAGDLSWANLLEHADDAQAHAGEPAQRLYILNPFDTPSLVRLHALEPRGRDRIVHPPTGKDFVLFEVPGIGQ